jgi:hypothetical protein
LEFVDDLLVPAEDLGVGVAISLIATASDTPLASRSVTWPCLSVWNSIPPNPCAAANRRQPVENDAGSHGSSIAPAATVANGYLRLDPQEWVRAVDKRRAALGG